MRVLVMESSTTSAKAMLYDGAQGPVRALSRPYRTAERAVGARDADGVFLETASVAREVARGEQIDAVALGGTWHSLMVADRDMKPLTPVFTWAFSGAREVAAGFRRDPVFVRDFYRRTGCMAHAAYPLFKALYLRETGLNIQAGRLLGQGSYNGYRLTGRLVTSDCTASGDGFLNLRERDWDEELLKLAGLGRGQLCRLAGYREPLPLSAAGSGILGLPQGTPVLPDYPDGALNQVGAGALGAGAMTFSLGTSGALRFCAKEPVLPEGAGVWCYLSPDAFLSGAATSGACNCLDWAKARFFPANASYAQIQSARRAAGDAPIFLPFLFGERCPGWNDARMGGFFDLRPEHAPIDLYKSVQEGVLFNLYQCYQILCRENGAPREIFLSGGIVNDSGWTQMCADIFGRDMFLADMPHASMVGGAVLAMAALDGARRIEDFKSAPARQIFPDPAAHALYEGRFGRYMDYYDKCPI